MTEWNKADIGIIGALSDEVSGIIDMLEMKRVELHGGVEFNLGLIGEKRVVVARCGVGKVLAALTAEAMIIKYSPDLLINTGVGGALDARLRQGDIVFADKLVQHDMDTSPLGDPRGLISGINRIYFETDRRAVDILSRSASSLGISFLVGTVASGDVFVASGALKNEIVSLFSASACEMEGAAIAQVAFVNSTPFVTIRAISDSADGEAALDYPSFLPVAVKRSMALTMALVKEY